MVVGVLVSVARPAGHVLLGEANAVVYSPTGGGPSLPDGNLRKVIRRAIKAASTSGDLLSLTIDYPLDEAVFPPDMAAPTFVWSDPAV